jgi:2-polyprenyl-6-methoxyphenol hydroxylase-like FAD-dependent oxidoreductase
LASDGEHGTTPDIAMTTCCIVGCGPAGAMLGLLLARAGVSVVVLEKYPDFFRDFRGDTIHASTLQVLDELNLLEGFDRLPHQKASRVGVMTDAGTTVFGDFTSLPGKFQYVAMVPQWDFLDFITDEAARYSTFTLRQGAEVIELIRQDGAVRGVRYHTSIGVQELRALLTVACDGRHSVVRRASGLPLTEFGAPMDVLWYRISRLSTDPTGAFLRLAPGRLFPMIDRETYWQGGCTIPKGGFTALKAKGIEALRTDLRTYMPFLADRVNEITGWDDVGFLEVQVNRLRRWHRPGLLCIGDAAHAMSPIGGVGINLAIQDAVAAANLLAEPLRSGRVGEVDLAAVQKRRAFPTRLTQRVQLFMQRNMVSAVMASESAATVPRQMRIALRLPVLRRWIPRFLAIGVRNEHVRTGKFAPATGTTGPGTRS